MYSAVKTFSETKAKERQELGSKVTEWIKTEQPQIVDTQVRQSSDHEFHCLSITIFYNPRG